jgi:hypothetical protein
MINFGSAARCEARLCRAVRNLRICGLCPRFGSGVENAGKPQAGGTAENFPQVDGGAEPRLTSGGRAASSDSKALFGQSRLNWLWRKSVRTINFGSAARCEARLCRAVTNVRIYGLCPRFGLWP